MGRSVLCSRVSGSLAGVLRARSAMLAQAGTVSQAIAFGDVLLVAVP